MDNEKVARKEKSKPFSMEQRKWEMGENTKAVQRLRMQGGREVEKAWE